MAKFMWIAGILFAAVGLALGVVVLFPTVPVTGVSLDMAVLLLVGGVMAIGIGSVIDGLQQVARREIRAVQASAVVAAAAIPEFDPRAAKVEAAQTVPPAAEDEVSEPTRNTIRALEDARSEIEKAVGGTPPAHAAASATELVIAGVAVDEEVVEEAVVDAGQLYVIEERIIRGRPSRILSDGTVEAETQDGWMRFENLEHLDEYLDAMEQAGA